MNFEALIQACIRAGQGVLAIAKEAQTEVQTKSDGSPLTRADLLAHQIVSEELELNGGGLPVISEEGEHKDPGADFWLLDPIDGTKDFIQGLSEYGVNLALVRNSKVVWGCIVAPALDQVFVGDVQMGRCELRTAGKIQELKLDPKRSHPNLLPKPRILLSINHPDASTQALLASLQDFEAMQVGSSLKFCALAQKRADWYPRMVGLSQWDLAAGHAILKAAGGNVWDLEGLELSYGWVNGGFASKPFHAW